MPFAHALLCVATAAIITMGCGVPSALASCKHGCDSCQSSEASRVECKAECDQMSALLDASDARIENHCSNADDVKQQVYNCYADNCNENNLADCLSKASTVVCKQQ